MRIPSIEIWLYKDRLSSLNQLISELPSTQQQRSLLLKNKRQREFVIGRSLLSNAVKKNSRSNDWSIREQVNSSPVVEHASQNFISSISHSKGWVALAFSEVSHDIQNTIGFDIEVIKPRQQFTAARYFCAPSQLRELDSAKTDVEKSRYYSQLWTLKEAYFKAHQQSIWNSQLKLISFKEGLSNETPGGDVIQSAFLGESLVLSVFSNCTSNIKTRLINDIGSTDEDKVTTQMLDWQTYSIEIESQE